MKLKKIILVIFIVICLFSLSLSAFAEEGINWYIKRAGNKRPEIEPSFSVIEKYNGYYIDKKVKDNDDKKIIYLTFDAGYENGNVSKILDILKEKNVPAAFFILSHLVKKNTELCKRMVDEGHLVCNHTKNHKDMSTLTNEEIKANLTELEEIYLEKTGVQMSKYFRFPEGRYSERSISCISDMGYKTVFWSFGYADWDDNRQPDAKSSMKLILDNTHNGEVILLHPTSKTNVEILPTLIDKWRDMGFEFGTLDMLCS